VKQTLPDSWGFCFHTDLLKHILNILKNFSLAISLLAATRQYSLREIVASGFSAH
jgi:hypothetical protein